jgi:Fe-S-cluster containining protein
MSFFSSFSLRNEFIRKLKKIEKDNPTAQTTGKTECCNSGVCCWKRPCELNMEDVNRLAAHFKLTAKEFFKKYCCVDYHDDKYILRFIRHNETSLAGTYLSSDQTYNIDTPCIFLKDSLCSVHDVKPEVGRRFQCWIENDFESPSMSYEQLIALGWDGEVD